MSYDTETARRYRRHATKLRMIAAGSDEQETIVILTGVARDYEQMARAFDATDFKNVTFLKRG